MLQGSGVELITVRTNLRELHEKWYDVFALGLASGFSLLSPGYGVGLIGSSDSYDTIDFLGGSNPVTDPLTSTGDMEVRLDGAGMSRTDKAAYLATWDLGMPLLRVCWQGRVADGNCGRCEKCVRTRLNFQIAGVPVPSCLPPVAGAQKRIWLKSGLAGIVGSAAPAGPGCRATGRGCRHEQGDPAQPAAGRHLPKSAAARRRPPGPPRAGPAAR